MSEIKLIVGLGNPLLKYENTRHNIGFSFIDFCCKKLNYTNSKSCNSFIFKTDNYLLQKPLTYMNLSGEAINKLCLKKNLKPEQILVVYDDIYLEMGRLRFRKQGSSGGHNGIKSIINCLGTKEFKRLKIGVGPFCDDTLENFVLKPLNLQEQETLQKSISRAFEAILMLQTNSFEAVMNVYNINKETVSGENE